MLAIRYLLNRALNNDWVVRCGAFSDYLMYDRKNEKWHVYNTYFSIEDVKHIVICEDGQIDIVLKKTKSKNAEE